MTRRRHVRRQPLAGPAHARTRAPPRTPASARPRVEGRVIPAVWASLSPQWAWSARRRRGRATGVLYRATRAGPEWIGRPLAFETKFSMADGSIITAPAPAPTPVDDVQVVTFGCRLNASESEAIRARTASDGLTDAVVFNTCAVTGEAVRQARQAIRKARRERPGARIVVTGCAAQIDPDAFAAMPEVDVVLGNADKAAPGAYAALRRPPGAGGRHLRRTRHVPLPRPRGEGPRPRPCGGAERLRPPLHLLRHPLRPGRFPLRAGRRGGGGRARAGRPGLSRGGGHRASTSPPGVRTCPARPPSASSSAAS